MTGTSFSFSPEEQHAFYAQPENQEPQGPPRRRKSSLTVGFFKHWRFQEKAPVRLIAHFGTWPVSGRYAGILLQPGLLLKDDGVLYRARHAQASALAPSGPAGAALDRRLVGFEARS